ncbi:MAG: hypothetical protein RL129_101 [Actinomycetota bacterium]|jgi:SAM-dependent methyltransferase
MDSNFDWYENYYKTISVAGKSGSLGNRLHHAPLERGYTDEIQFSNVLELGGGEGEHLDYIKHNFDNWVILDIRSLDTKFNNAKVTYIQSDAHKIPFEDSYFDRIVITCLLHHLERPWEVLAEVRRVAKNNCTVDILLPTDPSLAYRSAQFLTTGIAALKAGKYNLSRQVHSFEHRNHYLSLRKILEYVFQDDIRLKKMFPFPRLFPTLNLFAVYRITIRKAKNA